MFAQYQPKHPVIVSSKFFVHVDPKDSVEISKIDCDDAPAVFVDPKVGQMIHFRNGTNVFPVKLMIDVPQDDSMTYLVTMKLTAVKLPPPEKKK